MCHRTLAGSLCAASLNRIKGSKGTVCGAGALSWRRAPARPVHYSRDLTMGSDLPVSGTPFKQRTSSRGLV